jgi:WGR domain-containing protein
MQVYRSANSSEMQQNFAAAKFCLCCLSNLISAQEFGVADLIRESGQIGTAGQPKINLHDSEGAAVEVLEIWLRRTQRRGYVTRPD